MEEVKKNAYPTVEYDEIYLSNKNIDFSPDPVYSEMGLFAQGSKYGCCSDHACCQNYGCCGDILGFC